MRASDRSERSFDADAPFTPRGGCIAQAWSVAEVLRSFAATRGPRVG
jgi:glycogen debranching enzyme